MENNNYVGAPYNFVSFYNDIVAIQKEQMDVRGEMKDDLLSGEISYKLEAMTPVMIGSGEKDEDNVEYFFENEHGEKAIPGSSMRGLIRNNVQILGLAGFYEDIDDYNFMYRDVASGIDTQKYKEFIGGPGARKVRAGYIAKKGDEYVIYKTKSKSKGKNFFDLSEKDVSKEKEKFPFFQKYPQKLQNKVNRWGKYSPNEDYIPGFDEVWYNFESKTNMVCALDDKKSDSDMQKGVLIRNGYIEGKKKMYVIPEIDFDQWIELTPKDVNIFKNDFNKKENSLGSDAEKKFFNLPQDEKPKPVFYIEKEKGGYYFGFAPHLRLLCSGTVHNGYKQKRSDYDYAKSIFGMTGKKSGYKSKVSFSDAVACTKSKPDKSYGMILSDPKPSSYLDYLRQDGEFEDSSYNSGNFELRGVKQYWLHKEADPSLIKKNSNVVSSIQPLPTGTVFEGKVRFRNLTKMELGLLLWGMCLEKHKSWMNIGKAKPYGYGAIKLAEITVKTIDYKKAYDLKNELNFAPYTPQNVDELIALYKDEMGKQIHREIDQLPHIREFLDMKNYEKIPDKKYIRYMDVDAREYQKRKKKKNKSAQPLQSVEQVLSMQDVDNG